MIRSMHNVAELITITMQSTNCMNGGCKTTDIQYNIWRKIRNQFIIPQSICDHPANQWEVYDIDQAGCKQCGMHHVCDISTCNTITADEVRFIPLS
jgi:hypothetical protein